MAFRVGQPVECIDDSHRPYGTVCTGYDGKMIVIGERDYPLKRGRIYTIRELTTSHISGEPALKVEEILRRGFGDNPFRASRFRPIVERKTDISCFKAMLNPSLEDLAGHILNEVM